MKTRMLTALLSLAMLSQAGMAIAQETEIINCSADQDQAGNNLKLERIAPDMIHATGTIMAPSPAYKAALFTNNGDLVLEMIEPGPDVKAPAMIAAIKLDQTLTVPPLNTPIGVRVDKSFNWGPSVFVCEPVTRPDY